jgi:hypothetical protein
MSRSSLFVERSRHMLQRHRVLVFLLPLLVVACGSSGSSTSTGDPKVMVNANVASAPATPTSPASGAAPVIPPAPSQLPQPPVGNLPDGGFSNPTITPVTLPPPPATLPPDYVGTWGGYVLHQSCLHDIPNGATISENAAGGADVLQNGSVVASYPKCPYPMYRTPPGTVSAAGTVTTNVLKPSGVKPMGTVDSDEWTGWLEWFEEGFPLPGYSSYSAFWYVPNVPTSGDCSTQPPIGYYLGWQNENSILQPILAYEEVDGSCQWSIFNMYFVNGAIGFENPQGSLIVSPGDEIVGALWVDQWSDPLEYISYVEDENNEGYYWLQVNNPSGGYYNDARCDV